MRYRLRTLLALLFVVPPLLAVMVIAAMQKRPSGYDKSAAAHVALLETAANAYSLQVGFPPPDLDALLVPPSDLADPSCWDGPYLSGTRKLIDPWGKPYRYKVVGGSDPHFRIWSIGPDGLSGTNDDIDGDGF